MSEDLPLRRRVARLSLLAAVLFALCMALLGLALWVAFGTPPKDAVGLLPLATDGPPSVSLVLAAFAALGSLFGDEISEDAIMTMIAGAAAEESEVGAP